MRERIVEATVEQRDTWLQWMSKSQRHRLAEETVEQRDTQLQEIHQQIAEQTVLISWLRVFTALIKLYSNQF